MYQLNNLDVIILIVVGISALIALSRGLMKEVLSIIGWVLGCVAIIYLLPVLNPFTMKYIENGTVAGILTSIVILIVFLVIWILATGKIVSKIRSSKLSGLDRTLGLFFGIARAFLLIILLNILISWIVPKERQSPAHKIQSNSYMPELLDEQHKMCISVYDSLNSLRILLSSHPLANEVNLPHKSTQYLEV